MNYFLNLRKWDNRWLSSTSHKDIGVLYFIFGAFASAFIGLTLSLITRIRFLFTRARFLINLFSQLIAGILVFKFLICLMPSLIVGGFKKFVEQRFVCFYQLMTASFGSVSKKFTTRIIIYCFTKKIKICKLMFIRIAAYQFIFLINFLLPAFKKKISKFCFNTGFIGVNKHNEVSDIPLIPTDYEKELLWQFKKQLFKLVTITALPALVFYADYSYFSNFLTEEVLDIFSFGSDVDWKTLLVFFTLLNFLLGYFFFLKKSRAIFINFFEHRNYIIISDLQSRKRELNKTLFIFKFAGFIPQGKLNYFRSDLINYFEAINLAHKLLYFKRSFLYKFWMYAQLLVINISFLKGFVESATHWFFNGWIVWYNIMSISFFFFLLIAELMFLVYYFEQKSRIKKQLLVFTSNAKVLNDNLQLLNVKLLPAADLKSKKNDII